MSPRIVVTPDTPTPGRFSLATSMGNPIGARMLAGDRPGETPDGVVVPSLPPEGGYATEPEARRQAMLWNLYVRAVEARKRKNGKKDRVSE